jgi:hypothetical protein
VNQLASSQFNTYTSTANNPRQFSLSGRLFSNLNHSTAERAAAFLWRGDQAPILGQALRNARQQCAGGRQQFHSFADPALLAGNVCGLAERRPGNNLYRIARRRAEVGMSRHDE